MVDWQVELPGIGWLHSEGRGAVRLELDEQLLQRFPLKSPLVSLCSIPACFTSARQACGLQNITYSICCVAQECQESGLQNYSIYHSIICLYLGLEHPCC